MLALADISEYELEALGPQAIAYLKWQSEWTQTARPNQIPPEVDPKTGEPWLEFGAMSGRGWGKALDIDTPVPVPSGWRAMRDIKVGDNIEVVGLGDTANRGGVRVAAKNLDADAQADLVVCRAGASTVTEIAAVGAAAVFVPFPFAVDDHQTTNAGFLVDQGAGWLVQQDRLSPERLAHMLSGTDRAELLDRAQKAWNLRKTHATDEVVAACEELAR